MVARHRKSLTPSHAGGGGRSNQPAFFQLRTRQKWANLGQERAFQDNFTIVKNSIFGVISRFFLSIFCCLEFWVPGWYPIPAGTGEPLSLWTSPGDRSATPLVGVGMALLMVEEVSHTKPLPPKLRFGRLCLSCLLGWVGPTKPLPGTGVELEHLNHRMPLLRCEVSCPGDLDHLSSGSVPKAGPASRRMSDWFLFRVVLIFCSWTLGGGSWPKLAKISPLDLEALNILALPWQLGGLSSDEVLQSEKCPSLCAHPFPAHICEKLCVDCSSVFDWRMYLNLEHPNCLH